MEEQINQIQETVKGGLHGLYTNQHVINQKIDSLLTICAKNTEDIREVKQIVNLQSQQINYSLTKIEGLINKLSDMEIQMQNSNGDHDEITNSIQDAVLQIDDLKRTLSQWKVYSDIY